MVDLTDRQQIAYPHRVAKLISRARVKPYDARPCQRGRTTVRGSSTTSEIISNPKAGKSPRAKEFTDRVTGELREVDVVVEGDMPTGEHLVIGIEVADRSRKAEWHAWNS